MLFYFSTVDSLVDYVRVLLWGLLKAGSFEALSAFFV